MKEGLGGLIALILGFMIVYPLLNESVDSECQALGQKVAYELLHQNAAGVSTHGSELYDMVLQSGLHENARKIGSIARAYEKSQSPNIPPEIFCVLDYWRFALSGIASNSAGVANETSLPGSPIPNQSPPSQTDSEPLLAPQPQTTESLEQTAYKFAVNNFAYWSAANAVTLPYLESAYADQVQFYGKPTPQSVIIEEKQKFIERWPQRSYLLRNPTLSIMCDHANSKCTISGLLDWDASSPQRQARSAGVASFWMQLEVEGSSAKIVAEHGSVVSRNP